MNISRRQFLHYGATVGVLAGFHLAPIPRALAAALAEPQDALAALKNFTGTAACRPLRSLHRHG
jgi:hypothetical protein